MRIFLFILALAFTPLCVSAQTPGKQAFQAIRKCVMQNDAAYCHSVITPDSTALFDRFFSYMLMPCLPTDFTYAGEEKAGADIVVKSTAPAGGGNTNMMRMVFAPSAQGLKLDIPASLARGMGPNWQDKIQLSEQLYLMMKQNGNDLSCDQLTGLIKQR